MHKVGDNATYWLDHEDIALPLLMTLEKMVEKKDHNSLMIEIGPSLNDLEFDDVKNCANAKEMWDKLALVHGGEPMF